MSGIVAKKVKAVIAPEGIEDAEKFISTIVYPIEVKNIEIFAMFLLYCVYCHKLIYNVEPFCINHS